MTSAHTRLASIALAAAVALTACRSTEDRWLRVPDPDEQSADEGGTRKEDALALPPFPADDRLLGFEIGGASRNAYYVDAASISIGADWMIRYTAVVVSPSGARSITYEGMDCSDYAYKLYAMGRADGHLVGSEATRVASHHVHRDQPLPDRAVQGLLLSEEGAGEKLRRGDTRPSIGLVLSRRQQLLTGCVQRLCPAHGRSEQNQVVAVNELGLVDVAEPRFDLGARRAQDAA